MSDIKTSEELAAISVTKKRNINFRQLGILIVLAIMFAIFSIGSKDFFTANNMISILQQAAIKGTIAIGMTLVIITAGIDLSVGSITGLSAAVAAMIMVKNGADSIPTAIAAAIAIGFICGFINGELISRFKLQPFLVTMGTLSLYRGIEYIYTGAVTVRGLPPVFSSTMNAWNDSIPIPVIVMLAVLAIVYLVIKYTKWGRYVYAIGGNEEATRLSGVNVNRTRVATYTLMGVICAIAGLLYLGRIGSADANTGTGYEMDAIAAAAIGGASLAGGKGNLIGTILGAIMLAALQNGLTLLKVQSFYQTAATGLIIIIAVIIDRFTNRD